MHHLDQFKKSAAVGEITRKFSTNENTFTVGGSYAIDSLTVVKAKLNNHGKLGALLQHEVIPKSVLTVSGEVDTKALDKNPKFGLAIALRPWRVYCCWMIQHWNLHNFYSIFLVAHELERIIMSSTDLLDSDSQTVDQCFDTWGLPLSSVSQYFFYNHFMLSRCRHFDVCTLYLLVLKSGVLRNSYAFWGSLSRNVLSISHFLTDLGSLQSGGILECWFWRTMFSYFVLMNLSILFSSWLYTTW